MLDAIAVGAESRVVGDRRFAQHLARQTPELFVVLHRDQDLGAAARGKGAIGSDGRMGEADARPFVSGVLEMEQRHRHPVGHAVEQRYLDRASLAGALAQEQRFEDGGVRVEPGGDVAGRDADASRTLRAAGDRSEPALGLHQQVVGAAVAVGTTLAVARDVAGDEARVAAPQLLGAEARAGGRAGRQVLHEDVGAREQAVEQRAVVARP